MFYVKLIFGTLPRLALTLTSNPFLGLFLYVKFLLFLIIKKVTKNQNPWTFEFYYKKTGWKIRLYEGSVDIAALKELFLDKEYDWDAIREPKIILDCGAHTGNTSIYFHLLYPHARIYAIEASPKNFKKLQDNVKSISEIVPIFCAVSAHDGEVTFFETESSLGSSIHSRGQSSLEVHVPAMTFESLFKKLNIQKADFIKIDIEGSENTLFLSNSPKSFSSHYIIEVHEDLMGETGYTERYFDDFSNRKRPLHMEGRYLQYSEVAK